MGATSPKPRFQILSAALFFLVLFIQPVQPSPATLESVAEVTVVKTRGRRSTASSEAESSPSFYQVQVTAFDETVKLNLKPAGPIFSPVFKYNVVYSDEAGNAVWEDVTPSWDKLQALERSIYSDNEQDAVLAVEERRGEFSMDGSVMGGRIRRKRDVHVIQKRDNDGDSNSDSGFQFPKTRERVTLDRSVKDYIDTDYTPDLFKPRAGAAVPSNISRPYGPLHIQPELHFVIDYQLSKDIGDNVAILKYVAILLNGINSRYSIVNTAYMNIMCRFIGLTVIRDKSQQPFIEKGRYPNNNTVLIPTVTTEYIKWVYSNSKKLGSFDIAPLQLGDKSATDMRGLAWLAGSCKKDHKNKTDLATPVSYDGGAFYQTYNVAHEIAHSLGAPHDGAPGAEWCPWDYGYLMSYAGTGQRNKFMLSPCSLQNIEGYTRSKFADCLFENNGLPDKWVEAAQPGEIMDLTKLCAHFSPNSIPYEQAPDDFCRMVMCFDTKTLERILTESITEDDTPCGVGGKCQNGYCLGQTRPHRPLTLDEICETHYKPVNATNIKFILHPPLLATVPNYDVCAIIPEHTDPPSAILVCNFTLPNGAEISKPIFHNPAPGVRCDLKDPDKICLNKICQPSANIQTPEEHCQLYTGHNDVFEARMGNHDCTKLVCKFGGFQDYLRNVPFRVEYAPIESALLEESFCELNRFEEYGVCVSGQCYTPKFEEEDVYGVLPPWTLKRACEVLMGNETADVAVAVEDHGTLPFRPSQENVCSQLICELIDGKKVTRRIAGNNTPDGTKCGIMRVCKEGDCAPCEHKPT